MTKAWLAIFFLVTGSSLIRAQKDSSRHAVIPHVSPALRFTENKGQWDDHILFRAQLDGGALFLEKNALTFNFYDKKKYRAIHHAAFAGFAHNNYNIKGHAYKIYFEGALPDPTVERTEAGTDYENFFIGKDERRWKGNVKNYHRVWLRNLYPGIDYEVITATSGLKYNFHVKENANASAIRLKYEGMSRLKLQNGVLYLKLEVNEVTEQKPYAYQLINGLVKEVKCNYVLRDNVLSFDFPEGYDKSHELVIDPVLVFAAQSGSTADNFGMTATFDNQGNLYAGGTCFYQGYPVVAGSYDISFNPQPGQAGALPGLTDVVITKYNATGNSLVYSTYLGGMRTEIVSSLITDSLNNLYLYGATSSTDFPTPNGYDQTFNGGSNINFVFNGTSFQGGSDIYVSKFNPTGSTLLSSTYLGGSGNDGINCNNALTTYTVPICLYNIVASPIGFINVSNESQADSLQYNYGDQYRGEIQLDKNLDVYIASSTRSPDFPTVTPISGTLSGKQDAVVFKLSNNLSNLLYSTYLGGSGNDAGYSLIVDDTLQVFVTGGTYSSNFPTKPGCYQTTYNGGKADGFIAKINAAGNTLLKSTYIGTASYDQSYFIQSDVKGRIYVYGQSLGNMPVSPGVYANPNSHQFIARLDRQLNNVNLSTVFGSGSPTLDISPSAFAVDVCNSNIYLSGWGGSFMSCTPISNMPVTPNALYSNPPNGIDFYLMALSPNFNSLLYGTYFGGAQSAEHVDGGTSRFDRRGIIYQSVCAGCSSTTLTPQNTFISNPGQDFPVTPGAWPSASPVLPGLVNKSNNCNNGVFKLDFKLQNTVAVITSNTVTGCVPLTLTLTNSLPGTSYLWNLGNGVTTSVIPNPTITFTSAGVFTVSLLVIDTTRCVKKDSIVKTFTVFPLPTTNFTVTPLPCTNSVSTANGSSGSLGANPYTWNFGDGNTYTVTAPSHTYAANGDYTVTLTTKDVNGCSAAKANTVHVFNFAPAVNSASICFGSKTTLTVTGGTSYTWNPAGSLNNNQSATPIAGPTISTIYTVSVLHVTPQHTCAGTVTTQVLVNPTPTANFSFSVNPCGGGVNFTDLSAANVTAWNWQLSSSVTSTVQNPYQFYSTGGTYNVRLISINGFGCSDTITKPVTVGTPPPVGISSPTTVCEGGSVQLSATGGISYSWSPAASLDIPVMSNPNASPKATTVYSVIITTTSPTGPCQFLLTTTVVVTPLSTIPVSAQANPSFIITGNSSTLVYLGDPGAQVSWLPPGSTTPQTGYTVTAKPDKPTTYTAVAVKGACRQSAETHVDAYTEGCIDKDVFVPNTFTPNNDGQNDLFRVRGLKIDEVYFAVYNRWGEKVFETTDKTQGWDGLYKGRPADIGVFGWYLKVKCINGEETFRKGNVTLIR